jgi:hypothetical protein
MISLTINSRQSVSKVSEPGSLGEAFWLSLVRGNVRPVMVTGLLPLPLLFRDFIQIDKNLSKTIPILLMHY